MKKCVNCEHFKVLYEPLRTKGALWDLGRARCGKYDLITDFTNHTKLNRLECWNETEISKEEKTMKLDRFELYQDTKTKRVFAVFPADTDVDFAKKLANKYFKANFNSLKAVICYKRTIEGKEQIFPYTPVIDGLNRSALVLAVWRERN